jgi:HAD superfamily hydrolase (TIGR01490 family)
VGQAAAFFDLDRTVIAKSSALAFGRSFYRDGLMRRGDILKGAYARLTFRIGGTDADAMARTRDYLAELCAGWPVEQVRQIVIEALDELIHPYIYAEAGELIEQHKAAGHDVVLVSASGEEIVRPIGELLGVSKVIATRMGIADGHYTGEVEFYAAGEAKVEAVREMAATNGYDLAACYAYSDSASDVPLLAVVGHPTAVNPDRGMRRAATERGWPIRELQLPVPLRRRRTPRAVGVAAVAATGTAVGLAVGIAWYGRRRRRRAATAS